MIDREKIGLWGHSQGGWIVFLAASISAKIRFIVSNSGPGISLQEQDRYGLTHKNRALGVTEEEIEQALNLYAQVIEAVKSGEPYATAEKLIDAERNQAWDNYFNYSAGGWAFMRRNAEYDPFPIMQKVGCPVLAIFGEADRLVPAQRSASLIKEALATGKNPNFTFHIFPAADHRIKVNQGTSLASGYLNAMGMWLADRVKS
jgi:pimeloyl-ACP methyl ester carboxylesterase